MSWTEICDECGESGAGPIGEDVLCPECIAAIVARDVDDEECEHCRARIIRVRALAEKGGYLNVVD